MHATLVHVDEFASELAAEHDRSDASGALTDEAAKILRESGGMRLLQAEDHGGYQADLRDFLAWVRAVARRNPSAGWIAGVVGVHPWEIALADPVLQEEIYGTDPDTWVASPYAPQGRATRTGSGLALRGEWQYSTGTDHCQWVVLGGIVTEPPAPAGAPPDVRHFFLPRGDYEIVEDSWHVMGLSGTGSKNVRVDGAVVPEYRTVSHLGLANGDYGHRRAGVSLYQLPFGCVFSAAIASGTFGIARGTLDTYRAYVETRVPALGVVGKIDPFQQQALAEAEADLAAGIVHVDAMIGEMVAAIEAGGAITQGQRLEFRRNQTRAVQRVLASVDQLLARAGSAAVWTTRPIERFWRDLHTGATHLCNTIDTPYTSWANHALATGGPINTFH